MVSEQDLAERLAQFAWAVHTGDRDTLQALRRVIEAGGGTWQEDGNQVTCTGPSGIRGGFVPGQEDPVTAGVVVSFLLFGQLWSQVPFVNRAFGMLNKLWKEESKRKQRRRRWHRMFKVGDKVRFNKLYNGIVVEIAQWDEQNRRWRLSTGEHSVFGPYIIHIPEQNLVIGAMESEIQPLQEGMA